MKHWMINVGLALAVSGLSACATATPAPTATLTAVPATATTVPPTATTAPSATPAPSATAAPTETFTPAASPTAAASATAAATETPAATATHTPRPTVAGPASYAPTVASVWNTTITPDTMTGTCSGAVSPTYGLVQITPSGDTLGWRNQEPTPYTFSKTALNTYAYTGPTSINDGTVTMIVTFTSATTFQMTRTFVSTAEPSCTHVHQYSGVFQWNS